jgi:hypothetical protein
LGDDIHGVFQAQSGIAMAARGNATHIRMAREHGATIRDRVPVESIRPVGGEIEVVACGTPYRCRRLVVAAGAWSNRALEPFGVRLPLRVTKEQVTYFASPRLADFQPDRFPIWIWMDDPCFYGFPAFGEPGPKVGQDAGGQEVTADTRTFDVDEPARERVVRFLERHLPTALGPVIYTRTCSTLHPDRDFVVDTVLAIRELPSRSAGARLQVRVPHGADALGDRDRRRDPTRHRSLPNRPTDSPAGEPSDQLHGVTAAVPAGERQVAPARLSRAMGFRDLLLFYLVTGFSVRWIGNAASAGPSAVVIWLVGCVTLYVPLVFTVLELSSRYPAEGGAYVWSRRAFGDFAGFLTGWTYWVCNLPYFPSLFYFTAANALFIGPPEWQGLAESRTYFIVASLLGLLVAAGLNIRGLGVGKWLHNLGAVGMWGPALLLLGLGAIALFRFGPATPFTAEAMVPSTRLKDIVFWSTIAFSLSGLESASMMGDEIEDPRRNIPRALLLAGGLITGLYILATVAMLVALPPGEILNLQGFMQSIATASERVGLGWVTVLAGALLVAGGLGQAGAWFAASGRLPFVAGIDRFLPAVFGRIHPRYHSPYVSLGPGGDRRGVHLPGPGGDYGEGSVRRW